MAKLLDLLMPSNSGRQQGRLQALRQSLIRREARVGGQVFGPIPKGRKREFFCLDEHTWVWHEEWTDQNGRHRIVSTRYNVQPAGVLKSQNGGAYKRASRDEVRRLYDAATLYQDRVRKEVYNFVS